MIAQSAVHVTARQTCHHLGFSEKNLPIVLPGSTGSNPGSLRRDSEALSTALLYVFVTLVLL